MFRDAHVQVGYADIRILGTFLSYVDHGEKKRRKRQAGIWPRYPRLLCAARTDRALGLKFELSRPSLSLAVSFPYPNLASCCPDGM